MLGKELRIIDFDNKQLGVMHFKDALEKASEQSLDLVLIAPTSTPPVCRIMNYGKYLYEKSKKERDAKKKQHKHKVKEVKFRPNVEKHDYETKLNHTIAFLDKGCKVKISMVFRGRENAHRELGDEVLKRVIADTEEVAVVDSPPRRAGRMILMMLSPKTKK